MKLRRLRSWAWPLLALLFAACSKNWYPRLETQVYIPYVRGVYNLMDLLRDLNADSISVDSMDSTIAFYVHRTTDWHFLPGDSIVTAEPVELHVPPTLLPFENLVQETVEVGAQDLVPGLPDTAGTYDVPAFHRTLDFYRTAERIQAVDLQRYVYRLRVHNGFAFSVDTLRVALRDSASNTWLGALTVVDLAPGETRTAAAPFSGPHPLATVLRVTAYFARASPASGVPVDPQADSLRLEVTLDSVNLRAGTFRPTPATLVWQETRELRLNVPLIVHEGVFLRGTLVYRVMNPTDLPLTIAYETQEIPGLAGTVAVSPHDSVEASEDLTQQTYENPNASVNQITPHLVLQIPELNTWVTLSDTQVFAIHLLVDNPFLSYARGTWTEPYEQPISPVNFFVFPEEVGRRLRGLFHLTNVQLHLAFENPTTCPTVLTLHLVAKTTWAGVVRETTMVREVPPGSAGLTFSGFGGLLNEMPDSLYATGTVTLSGSGEIYPVRWVPIDATIVSPFDVEVHYNDVAAESTRVYLQDKDARSILRNARIRTGRIYLFVDNNFPFPLRLQIQIRSRAHREVTLTGNVGAPELDSLGLPIAPLRDTVVIGIPRSDLNLFKEYPWDVVLTARINASGTYTLTARSRFRYRIWAHVKGEVSP